MRDYKVEFEKRVNFKFLLVSFLLSIISDTSFFLCCVDSFENKKDS